MIGYSPAAFSNMRECSFGTFLPPPSSLYRFICPRNMVRKSSGKYILDQLDIKNDA